MLRVQSTVATKIWSTFLVTYPDGHVLRLCIIDLPQELYDDYVDFQINHFVKRECFRQIAGIPYSGKALDECRTIIKNTCGNPLHHNVICCPEVGGKIEPKILATYSMHLLKKNKYIHDVMAKTKEVCRFYEIKRYLDDLYPIHEVMKKHDVDDALYPVLAVHQEYSGLGIATKIFSIGLKFCEANNIRLCFSWFTSEGSQKVAKKQGWATEYKIKAEDVTKKFNVPLGKPPTFFKFQVYNNM